MEVVKMRRLPPHTLSLQARSSCVLHSGTQIASPALAGYRSPLLDGCPPPGGSRHWLTQRRLHRAPFPDRNTRHPATLGPRVHNSEQPAGRLATAGSEIEKAVGPDGKVGHIKGLTENEVDSFSLPAGALLARHEYSYAPACPVAEEEGAIEQRGIGVVAIEDHPYR
jgi:hypothetical protein